MNRSSIQSSAEILLLVVINCWHVLYFIPTLKEESLLGEILADILLGNLSLYMLGIFRFYGKFLYNLLRMPSNKYQYRRYNDWFN